MKRIEEKLDFLILCLMDSGTLSPGMQSRAHDLLFGSHAQEPLLDKIIERHLFDLGMPCNFVGFNYSRDAIRMVIEDPELSSSATKIYAAVGDLNHATGKQVERGIRHAVEAIMAHGDTERIYAIFGATIDPEKAKPTTGQFIARMARHISDSL